MGFNYWIIDIMDGEWVVEIDALLVQILLIIHFGKLRHGYFKINVRTKKAWRLLT